MTLYEKWQIALAIFGGVFTIIIASFTVVSWYLARKMELEIKLIEVLAADDAIAFSLLNKLQTGQLDQFWEEAQDHLVQDIDPPELNERFSEIFERIRNEIAQSADRLVRNAELRQKLQSNDMNLNELQRSYKIYLYHSAKDKADNSLQTTEEHSGAP